MTELADQEEDVTRIVGTKRPPITRFLSKPPRGATKLLLHAGGPSDSTTAMLGQWEHTESKPAAPELAEEVLRLFHEHCVEVGATVRGVLEWRNKAGAMLSQKLLTAMPEREPSRTYGSAPEELTGDATSLVVQAQKHTEVMSKLALQSMNSTLHQSQLLSQQAMELVAEHARARSEAEERADNMKRERDDALEQLRVRQEAEADGDDPGTAEAQQRVMKMLEPVMPLLLAKFLGPGAGASPPPTTPPSG